MFVFILAEMEVLLNVTTFNYDILRKWWLLN